MILKKKNKKKWKLWMNQHLNLVKKKFRNLLKSLRIVKRIRRKKESDFVCMYFMNKIKLWIQLHPGHILRLSCKNISHFKQNKLLHKVHLERHDTPSFIYLHPKHYPSIASLTISNFSSLYFKFFKIISGNLYIGKFFKKINQKLKLKINTNEF